MPYFAKLPKDNPMSESRNDIYNINKEQCANQNSVDRQAMESRQLIESTSNAGLNQTQSEGLQGRSETERFGFYNANQTQRAADRTNDEVEKFGLYNADKIERNGDRNYSAIRDGIDSANNGFRQVEIQAANSKAALELEAAKNKGALELDAAKNKSSIELQAAANSAAVELSAERNANAAAVAATLNAYNSNLTATTNFNALTTQANLIAAASEVLAVKNQAVLEAKLAECCCEQRELARALAKETQDLIRAEAERNLRDKLAEKNDELNALRMRASLLPALTPGICVA